MIEFLYIAVLAVIVVAAVCVAVKFLKTTKYIREYVNVSPQETYAKHAQIVMGVYSFCPHCFSQNVQCVMEHCGCARAWVCNDCENVGPATSDCLSALMAWHREHYEQNTADKVNRKNYEQIGN